MAFVVETGRGTPNANAYTTETFVTSYLTDRGRETENSWSTLTTAQQQDAIVKATDYLDRRWGTHLNGIKLRKLIPGRAADGTIAFASNPSDTETVTIGQITYRFVNTLVQENDVAIGSTTTETAANLVAALGATDDGTNVHEDTRANYEVEASSTTGTVTVAAQAKGVNGNEITFSTTTGATISGSGTLTGGVDEGPQPLEFPRTGLTDKYGNQISGVPLTIRQATAEYAVRVASAVLVADPSRDDTGVAVQETFKKVGPLEKKVVYVNGARRETWPAYPLADALVKQYASIGGSTR